MKPLYILIAIVYNCVIIPPYRECFAEQNEMLYDCSINLNYFFTIERTVYNLLFAACPKNHAASSEICGSEVVNL